MARLFCMVVLVAMLSACGGDDDDAPDGSVSDGGPRRDSGGVDGSTPDVDGGPGRDAGEPPASVAARARALATELRGDARFLIGMGNDLDGPPTYDPDLAGAFTLGVTLDIHYMYLVGYSDMGGWVTWNDGGAFPTIHADAANANGGVVPMFSYYQLALDYETGADTLTDAARMRVWLSDVRTLFTRLGATDRPALVHFEPDLFGYLQQRMASMGTTPDAYVARIQHTEIPECAGLPDVAASLGPCLIAMRAALAPRVRIGLHASQWGDSYDPTDPAADVEAKARSVAQFLAQMGGDAMDFVVVETLDRDAGFWETSGGTAMCSVTGGTRGAVYWDESNATLPNFTQYFRWVRAVTEALELPALFWQTPFGVPSDTCGGTDGHYRDNRVRYFFAHTDELVAAGAFGAVFGTGADRQTYITSDDGQFQTAVTAYVAAPQPL